MSIKTSLDLDKDNAIVTIVFNGCATAIFYAILFFEKKKNPEHKMTLKFLLEKGLIVVPICLMMNIIIVKSYMQILGASSIWMIAALCFRQSLTILLYVVIIIMIQNLMKTWAQSPPDQ